MPAKILPASSRKTNPRGGKRLAAKARGKEVQQEIEVNAARGIRGLAFAACAILSTANLGRAHDPITTKITWTREISRIFFRRCLACHGPAAGPDAPSISLTTYDEARPWAKAIKDEVLARRMPPWGPAKGFGNFKNDAGLSSVEIDLIVNWVEGGAPEGDPLYLPALPKSPPHDAAELHSRRLTFSGTAALDHNVTAVGIEPTGPVRATARPPGGAVLPLVWIRDFRPGQPKTYRFREPLKLPKGTVLKIDGTPAALLIEAPAPAQ
jgi:mono/diheme cytochrome c family protein